jgi:hypothetical protein
MSASRSWWKAGSLASGSVTTRWKWFERTQKAWTWMPYIPSQPRCVLGAVGIRAPPCETQASRCRADPVGLGAGVA